MANKNNIRRFLSKADLQTLLTYVKSQADVAREKGTIRAIVDELIVILLVRAGLRPNEIRSLRIKDLPTEHGESALWIRNEKGEVLRKVDIASEIAQLVSRFIRLYRKGAQKEEFLLTNERGRPFRYISLYNKVRRIGTEAKIGQLTPSIVHRTFMVCLYEAKKDLRYVQEQTGYLSRRTLTKYLMKGRERTRRDRGRTTLIEQIPAEKEKILIESTCICEACGAQCVAEHGRRIDSGQFLCHQCLEYFQSS